MAGGGGGAGCRKYGAILQEVAQHAGPGGDGAGYFNCLWYSLNLRLHSDIMQVVVVEVNVPAP